MTKCCIVSEYARRGNTQFPLRIRLLHAFKSRLADSQARRPPGIYLYIYQVFIIYDVRLMARNGFLGFKSDLTTAACLTSVHIDPANWCYTMTPRTWDRLGILDIRPSATPTITPDMTGRNEADEAVIKHAATKLAHSWEDLRRCSVVGIVFSFVRRFHTLDNGQWTFLAKAVECGAQL